MERVIAILGATGSGKTTKMVELLKPCRRVFLVEPFPPDEKFNDFPTVRTLEEIGERSQGKTFRLRLITDKPEALETICWLAFQHRHNCVVAVDEIHEYVPSFHLGIPFWFRKCILRGRHRGVTVIGASQRTANVHNDFLTEAANHRIYLFQSQPEDLGVLKRYKELHSAATLKVGQFLTWPPASLALPAAKSPRVQSRQRKLK